MTGARCSLGLSRDANPLIQPSAMTPRIYANFNGYCQGGASDWVELDTYGTLVDLHFYQIRLEDGLQLVACDNEEMEVAGACRYHGNVERPHWCLHFEPGTLRYIPITPDRLARPFVCFRCRNPLPQSVRLPENQECPTCSLSIHYPWEPPECPVFSH